MSNPDNSERYCGTCIYAKPLPAMRVAKSHVHDMGGRVFTHACDIYPELLVNGAKLPFSKRYELISNPNQPLKSCYSALRESA